MDVDAKKKKRRVAILQTFGFLGVIIGITVLFSIWPPGELVEILGVNNSLLVAALVALLGGVSTLTSASFFGVIGGLALGGLPVGLMMLVCGPALLLGDLLFYAFGRTTHDAWGPKARKVIRRFEGWVDNAPQSLVQVGIILYTGFSPFPGDILMITLALAQFKFRRIVLPLLLGNMLLVGTIAWVAKTGQSFF